MISNILFTNLNSSLYVASARQLSTHSQKLKLVYRMGSNFQGVKISCILITNIAQNFS